MQNTVFITDASRGFGKRRTATFLKRGDKVVAIARYIKSLEDLAKDHTKVRRSFKVYVNLVNN